MKGEAYLRRRIDTHQHPRRIGHEMAVNAHGMPLLCGLLDAQTYTEAAETISAAVCTLTTSEEKLFAVTLRGPCLYLESHAIAQPDSVVIVMNRNCSIAALAEAIKAEDSMRWGKGTIR